MMNSFDIEIAESLLPDAATVPTVRVTGEFHLVSVFDVSGLALAALSAAATQLAMLIGADEIVIDRRLTEHWYDTTLQPIGWNLPASWDSIAGNYRSSDGWIRLHTNVPAHRSAVLSVLGIEGTKDHVAAAVARWDTVALESAVVAAGGVAAAMQSLAEWASHPQGRAVATEPLIAWKRVVGPSGNGPALKEGLKGLRVLDLTRVLAGPVATRFLAGFGASVLRIDPPGWQEDGLEPEITLGKACAGLDLHDFENRRRFEPLLSEAHVLVHGYRPGALERLGYGEAARRRLNPSLIDVSLSAYGWSGPWRERRGFDTIVQMNTGLAHQGMARTCADGPVPLPVQVLDHATGYLMAASVLRALREQRDGGGALSARLSLARTAGLLISAGVTDETRSARSDDLVDRVPEQTYWGPARRVAFPVRISGKGPQWKKDAGPFRAGPTEWP